MRLLHTSDWHLGQHFFGKSRQAEHAAFLAWLLQQVAAHQVDAVIVAGDVFDTASPPSHAREAYHQFVLDMHDAGARLVVLGGNHDSPAVLQESRGLLARLHTWVVPSLDGSADEHVLLLHDRAGQPGALLCAIPFIRAREVRISLPGEQAEQRREQMMQGIAQHYAAIHAAAVQRRQALGLPLPIVASGHLTTVGASSSESVREIYVGSLSAFPTDAFPPADYIALGHIHRPQQAGAGGHIRYSGSPLALGFDELGTQKQVLLVDLSAEGLQAITALPVPVFQPMHRLSDTLKGLAPAFNELAATVPAGQVAWLEVEVRGDEFLPDLPARVAGLLEGLPLEVLRLRRARRQQPSLAPLSLGLDELQPAEVFARRLAMETVLEQDERLALEQRFDHVLAGLQEGNA